MYTIVLCSQHPVQLLWLNRAFSEARFSCRITTERRALLNVLGQQSVDGVVFDAALGDAEELCREVRTHHTHVPLIIIGTRATLAERVALLRAGADDVVIAGVPSQELLARMQAKLRRSHAAPTA